MPNSVRSRFRVSGSRRGAAYILAVTTLLVGTTLALAMLSASGTYFMAQDSRRGRQAAADLAQAGVEYAFWQVHYRKCPLPYSANVRLSTGSFSVTAIDDGARDPSTMLITSTGTAGKHQYTVKRVTLGLLPYHYAYCENTNTDDNDSIDCSGVGLGMRANGGIRLDDVMTRITNGAWATLGIATKGFVSPQYPNQPPVTFPPIDIAYYNSIATVSYPTDTMITSLNCPAGALIVVNGRLNISGAYLGVCTIVAAGDVKIIGSLVPADQNSYLAIICTGHIDIEVSGVTVQAILYGHKLDNNGEVHVRRALTTIRGVWASDDNKTDRDAAVRYDQRLNLAIMKRLRLPGL